MDIKKCHDVMFTLHDFKGKATTNLQINSEISFTLFYKDLK